MARPRSHKRFLLDCFELSERAAFGLALENYPKDTDLRSATITHRGYVARLAAKGFALTTVTVDQSDAGLVSRPGDRLDIPRPRVPTHW